MATLQYRPIDAPDFGTALQALRASGGFLDNAFGAAQSTLGMLRNQQTQGAEQQVLMRALQQQDAAGLSGALADGSLFSGINPNLLSAGVLTGLQDQIGTRLNQDRTRQMLETGALGLEEGRYNFGRTQDLNQRTDDARGAINAIAEASQRGDTAAVQQLRNQYRDVLGNLSGDQAISLAKDSQGLVRGELQQRSGELGIVRDQFGLDRDRYNLSIDQRNDREGRSANVLANEVLRMSAGAEDARAVLESMEGLDPNVRAAATRLVQSAFPGTYGPLGSGASGPSAGTGAAPSAPGTAGTRNGSAYDTSFEFQATPRPITQMAIGDVIDHQSSMISRQGHSPLGAFQINKATLEDFGPRVLGKDWKSQNFTPENQNKIGEAIFNARKNGNLKDTWAALPNSTPGAYKDMTWDQMRQQISQAEVGQAVGRGGNQQLQTGSAAAEVLTRAMQNNATGIGNDYADSIQDNRDAGAVLSELTGEGGSFAGANRADVLREINRVMTGANVNAATAAAVLRRNIAQEPGTAAEYLQYAANRIGSPFRSSPNLGNGIRVNDEGVDAAIQSLRSGGELTNFQRNAETGAVLQRIQTAQQQYTDAVSQLSAMTQRAATQPGLRAQLPRYQQRVQLAQASLEAAREAQRALPQLRPEFERTAPEPVAQSRGGTSSRTTEILRDAAAASLPSGVPAAGYRGQGRNW